MPWVGSWFTGPWHKWRLFSTKPRLCFRFHDWEGLFVLWLGQDNSTRFFNIGLCFDTYPKTRTRPDVCPGGMKLVLLHVWKMSLNSKLQKIWAKLLLHLAPGSFCAAHCVSGHWSLLRRKNIQLTDSSILGYHPCTAHCATGHWWNQQRRPWPSQRGSAKSAPPGFVRLPAGDCCCASAEWLRWPGHDDEEAGKPLFPCKLWVVEKPQNCGCKKKCTICSSVKMVKMVTFVVKWPYETESHVYNVVVHIYWITLMHPIIITCRYHNKLSPCHHPSGALDDKVLSPATKA